MRAFLLSVVQVTLSSPLFLPSRLSAQGGNIRTMAGRNFIDEKMNPKNFEVR
jgi:hypothetical protein